MSQFTEWLMANHVPSFGPQTVMALAKVRDALRDSFINCPPQDSPVAKDTLDYLLALQAVITVGIAQQGAVIEELATLIKEATEEGE